ncbi:SRPBCC domain-containing protein (plasmid) [Novosphingobium sp. THN1]|uniref:SRPBCC domain-containing protein n=1 Tax=Novosphingobium sp. THN1 TaxID=1016987 RepID=UPI000E4673D1|nr:SRPBCC domain-containing protein [Novosphingobium sp. THN1]AXU21347.1 SRPBCC domain-containing protein [Novosphingobium sp. THN1]
MLLDWMKSHPTLADDAVSGFDPDAVTVSETVEIAAPARVVWAVLTDMPRYAEWNPFCVRAVSTLEMGAAVDMTLVNYAVPGTLVPNCEYICAFEPERMISWEMVHSDFWPYPARRDQVIEPTGDASCRYFSTDAFLGNNGIHVFRFAGPWVKRAFDDSARALKARAELLYAQEQKA